MKTFSFLLVEIILLFSFAIPFQTYAVVLEEITVTAQKREQDLQDVAISITAFSGEQLRQLGFTSTDTFDEQVPGLMVTSYGGGVTTIFNIRGSQQLDFADQHEAPVAVYIDGSYNSYLAGVGFNFFDLDRIEVLRGPQGTLFGRNATGGVVHLISKKPGQETEGYIEAGGGEYGKYIVEAALGGGLSETVAARVSLYREKNDGYTKNLLQSQDTNQTDNWSTRGQLLFEPNDDLSILINGRYSTDDVTGGVYNINPSLIDIGGIPGLPGDGSILEGTPAQQLAYCTAAPALGVLSFAPVLGNTNCFGYVEDNDPSTVSANTLGFFKRDHFGISGTITWDTEIGEITSITDWQDFEKRYLEDTDSTPLQLFDFFQDMNSNQFSQELRLRGERDNMRWVVGAYYLNIDSSYRVGVDGAGTGVNVDPATGAPTGPLDQDSFGAIGISLDNNYNLETTTYAFFAQLEYDFNAQWTMTGGLRWTEDEKDFDVVPQCGFAPGLADISNGNCLFLASLGPFAVGGFGDIVQGVASLSQRRTEGDWSGHIEIDYKPNDDWLLYAKVTRGHKAGGFNSGGTLFFRPDQLTYDSELPISYEAGFKGSFWDGRARLNGSGFYIDYNDFQTFVQSGLSLLVFNVDAEVYGSELELALNPAEGWDFLFGLSILDANQQNVDGPGGAINRPMPNSPDISFNALGRYEWAAFNGRMAAQMDMQYVDDRSLNGIDHPSLQAKDYTVANASLSWASRDEHWDLRLYVKNFTDEAYIPTLFDLAGIQGTNIEQVAAPRWFGGSVRYNFF